MTARTIGRGSVCWATVPAGFGHDQGTRPWVVLSQVLPGVERAIAVPISSADPSIDLFPLTWPVPSAWGLDRPSWAFVDHVRSLPVARLRDGFAQTTRDELLELLAALGELLGTDINAR